MVAHLWFHREELRDAGGDQLPHMFPSSQGTFHEWMSLSMFNLIQSILYGHLHVCILDPAVSDFYEPAPFLGESLWPSRALAFALETIPCRRG